MSTRDTHGDSGFGGFSGDSEDPVERMLRDALTREADMVQPSDDGLARITQSLRTGGDAYGGSGHGGGDHPDGPGDGYGDDRGSRPGWKPWVAGLVAASVVGVVAGLVYAGNREEPTDPVASPTGTSSPTTSPTDTPTTTPTESETTPPAPTGELEAIPVYWLGESKVSVWLYREFRTVPDVGGPVASAVSAMTSLEPQDPDYSTPWSPASRVTVTQDGEALTVDLSADAFAGSGVGSQVAERAVQQLVWTATAAAQAGGPVTITVDGEAYDAWGAISLGGPMTRDNDVRGQVWIDSPTEGQTVAAGAVTVAGNSRSFEATVNWEVQDASGDVVADGFTMGGANETYGPFEFSTTDLAAGTYTVHVWAEDVSSGESAEGPRMFEQTRTFTVE